MAAKHGSTPAAWAAVTICLVGVTISAIGSVMGPNWLVFWVGVVLLPVSMIVGKVMSAAGMGAEAH